jgi:hypothetical protein
MKNKIALSVLFLFTVCFSSCEKDDICDANTPTTPQLVIEFYDAVNTTTLKSVTNLSINGVGGSGELLFSGVNTIKLPLKTNAEVTQYDLKINSTDATLKNSDELQFNYTRKDQFVSRACGFKTLFYLDPITPFEHMDSALSDGLWIKNILVNTSNIETENETHIKIYF